VAWPLSSGAPMRVVAGRLGETEGWAKTQLERLRAELQGDH
jgi:hypothetical protein